MRRTSVMPHWTRRKFLWRLSLAGGGCLTRVPNLPFWPKQSSVKSPSSVKTSARPLFEEVPSSTTGITWRHVNGRSPDYYLPETTGAGCAFLDYDNDGWMDIYLVNSGKCDFFAPSSPLSNALYRNNRDGTFTDVTKKAGVPGGGYGMGVAGGDYDGDGWPDLYVTQYGRSILYHNNGDGTFTDVSAESGIAKALGKAWGVVATDVNNDGWMDLFVANDTVANFLFVNKHNGKFEDAALEAGVAYSQNGRERSGMGVDSADYDQDGWQDLFVTNVDQEMYSIYRNNHDLTFEDKAGSMGLGRLTRLMSGWGVKFFDYDNDGNVDLFIANGHPDDKIESHSSHIRYKEPLLLLHNNGRVLENVGTLAGPVFAESFAARGMAVGDFNNDGALDVLVAVNDGPPLLLENNAAAENHWLGLRLIGKKSNPDAIGATIMWQAGNLKRTRLKVGGGSYLSSHDPREVLGIGKRKKIDKLEIRWPRPSTRVDTFTNLPIDRYITITEAAGFK